LIVIPAIFGLVKGFGLPRERITAEPVKTFDRSEAAE
jgi:hypothetical protein